MDSKVLKSYIFTYEELYSCLAITGAEKWFGLVKKDPGILPGKAEINRALASLYKYGVISLSGKELQLNEEYREAFDIMARPERVIALAGRSLRKGTVVSYIRGKSSVRLEEEKGSARRVRITEEDVSELKKELLEDAVPFDDISGMETGIREPGIGTSLGEKIEGKAKEAGVLSVIDSMDEDGETLERVTVIERGIRVCSVYESRSMGAPRITEGSVLTVKTLIERMIG